MWFQSNIGEIAALCTALFWTITALAFESASKKIGSLNVNIIRLCIGFIFLTVFISFYRGIVFPTDATLNQWFWLSLSGIIGFVFGDYFLFKSYTLIGSRFAMLIMTLVPPITAFFGFVFLHETLNAINFLGMLLTLIGISLAILKKDTNEKRITIKLSGKGMLYAFAGAVGQAGGLIASKLGMSNNYSPFAATQIRIITGIIGFAILITFLKQWKPVFTAVKNVKAMQRVTLGSFFGPFLGVSFSLLAIQYTETGIASTIMAMVPIFILLPTLLLYKQKITFIELLGAIISVVGVTLFFVL